MQTSKEKIDELSDNLSKKLDVYDQILSKQKYLTGEVTDHSTVRQPCANSSTIEHHLGRSLPCPLRCSPEGRWDRCH
jgi:hypothetical protein